ncbi:hypothetical protein WS62_28180 [Burkholderia sp. ABCPW 14]|nr:hypothetical protein WS62_28180 [Burkholderia sp. ABCPW 14]
MVIVRAERTPLESLSAAAFPVERKNRDDSLDTFFDAFDPVVIHIACAIECLEKLHVISIY